MLIVIVIIIAALFFLLWRFERLCLASSEVDWGSPFMNRIDGFNRLLCSRFHHMDITGVSLPETGCALVACNHISGLDPFLLVAANKRKLHFLIAREEYERFGLTWLFRAAGCIPVDRGGKPEVAFRDAKRVLEQGGVVAIFPHGKIHLDSDPPLKLKAGVVKLAQYAGCPIYPFYLQGVRGQGHVIRAVFIPSHVQITGYEPVSCDLAHPVPELLETLSGYFKGSPEDGPADTTGSNSKMS
ncbi:MAG: hypothetical protein BMS9Abin26_1093 [Gammaproteobacteria bacterium]|nr:MAG: hypothetical protein BMS9Abin26_1093 [Gammaproteobacteria bacterium]